MPVVASGTFLFDAQRSGRSPHAVGNLREPDVCWETWLRAYPPSGAESSAGFDAAGNLYFGSHNGTFYSLSPSGEIRWVALSTAKIYGSPLVLADQVIYTSGDGFCHSFSLDGELRWRLDLSPSIRGESSRQRAVRELRELPDTLDVRRKYLVTIKSWASPVQVGPETVVVTGYSAAVQALDFDGGLRWKFALPGSAYTLSGACADPQGNVYATSFSGHGFCIHANGKESWRVRLPRGYRNWGSPSFDVRLGQVLFPMSRGESDAKVSAVLNGVIRWEATIPGGVRGSVVFAYDSYLVAGLDGNLRWLEPNSGRITRTVRLSKAERGLWTTPAITADGQILITTKQSNLKGTLVCLEPNGEKRWEVEIGKALSVPVIDAAGRVYVGSWDGNYRCFQT